MIRTEIGSIALVKNQIKRLSSLHSQKINALSFVGGIVYAYSDSDLSENEKADLVQSVGALSKSDFPTDADKKDFESHPLKDLTPSEAEAWIDANVTDMASAKLAMKQMIKMLVYLARRSDL